MNLKLKLLSRVVGAGLALIAWNYLYDGVSFEEVIAIFILLWAVYFFEKNQAQNR